MMRTKSGFPLISLSPFPSKHDWNLKSRCSAMFVKAWWERILKEELLFEATGPGSLREREGRRRLWCAKVDNIKGWLTKKKLPKNPPTFWPQHKRRPMLLLLGWMWSRWLKIVASLPETNLGYDSWKMWNNCAANFLGVRPYIVSYWKEMITNECCVFACLLSHLLWKRWHLIDNYAHYCEPQGSGWYRESVWRTLVLFLWRQLTRTLSTLEQDFSVVSAGSC